MGWLVEVHQSPYKVGCRSKNVIFMGRNPLNKIGGVSFEVRAMRVALELSYIGRIATVYTRVAYSYILAV